MIKIGNLPDRGVSIEVGKWYFGIELYKCRPTMIGVFKPYVLIYCFKIIKEGEPWKIHGTEEEKLGGWVDFESPIGIIFKFIK